MSRPRRIGWVVLVSVVVGVWVGVVAAATAASPNQVFQLPEDRRVDWALAGVPGGVPHRDVVCATIDGTLGDGATDATSAIQSALDGCPAGRVVVLPEGVYRTTATINLRSNVTLRGAGPDRTILSFDGARTRSVLDMRGSIYNDITHLRRTYQVLGAERGSSIVALDRVEGISPGDVLLIDHENDGALVDNVGSEGPCTYCSRLDGSRVQGQLAEVMSVDGNNAQLSLPLFFEPNPALSPEAVLVSAESMVRHAGAEDLGITQVEPVNDFIVEMDGAQYSWLRNVHVFGMRRRGLWHIESLQNEIRDSTFSDAVAGYGRDRGYGIQMDLQSTANLIENNILDKVDGGGLMASGGAIGNVFGYNFLPDIRFDDPWWMIGGPSSNHSAHPSMNLWEGNVGQQISGDFIHGSSSHQTFFRCRSAGWKEEAANSNNNAVDFQHKNNYMSVVGCVLGTEGRSDTYEVAYPEGAPSSLMPIWRLGYGGPDGSGDQMVKDTLIRHGNWDAVTGTTIWQGGITERDLPASLYRASKPHWWGDLEWPAIGPDLTPMVGKIPAQVRYEGGAVPTSGPPPTAGTQPTAATSPTAGTQPTAEPTRPGPPTHTPAPARWSLWLPALPD